MRTPAALKAPFGSRAVYLTLTVVDPKQHLSPARSRLHSQRWRTVAVKTTVTTAPDRRPISAPPSRPTRLCESLHEERRAMKSYRCDDWSSLAGATVEMHRRGQLVRSGVVDAVTHDASILWLAADYNGNRALFESAEGYEVWADPKDLPDELYSAMLCQQPPTAIAWQGRQPVSSSARPQQ